MAVTIETAKVIFGDHYVHSSLLEAASQILEHGETPVKLSWELRQRVVDILAQTGFRLVGVTCDDSQFFIYYFDPAESIVDAVTFNYRGDVQGCILRELVTVSLTRKNQIPFTIN